MNTLENIFKGEYKMKWFKEDPIIKLVKEEEAQTKKKKEGKEHPYTKLLKMNYTNIL